MPYFKIDVTHTQRAEFLVKAKNADEAKAIFKDYADENAGYLDVLDRTPNQTTEIAEPIAVRKKPDNTFNVWEDEEDEMRKVDCVDPYA